VQTRPYSGNFLGADVKLGCKVGKVIHALLDRESNLNWINLQNILIQNKCQHCLFLIGLKMKFLEICFFETFGG
jgi:hypothetical protein